MFLQQIYTYINLQLQTVETYCTSHYLATQITSPSANGSSELVRQTNKRNENKKDKLIAN